MPLIDLRPHILDSNGVWKDPEHAPDHFEFPFALTDTQSPAQLMLRWEGDYIELGGPLVVQLTYQVENVTRRQRNKESQTLQASTLYSYTLNIAGGESWQFALRTSDSDTGMAGGERDLIGNNLGFRLLIEPAFGKTKAAPVSACDDLPCDFAVGEIANTGQFFPSACEPCAPGASVGLPPVGPSLAVPAADGGCVRARFFNGMFITREDFETEQRYQRIKSRLHNRASGAGVVWGLAVGKQANQVHVLPGYAVDCCGNDLTVTAPYKVDVSRLVMDPLAARAAAGGRPVRMHLLLEYVECPAEPRPVHGDPCAPDVTRCEMSRIRETVRLRLVPPRDVNAVKESAPLAHFLDEVRALNVRFPLTVPPTWKPLVRTIAPFLVRLSFQVQTGAQPPAVDWRPGGKLGLIPVINGVTSIQVQVMMDPLWSFVAGRAIATQTPQSGTTTTLLDQSLAPDPSVSLPSVTFQNFNGNTSLTFRLKDWRAETFFAPEDASELAGDATLNMTVTFMGPDAELLPPDAAETPITAVAPDLDRAPCEGDRCQVTFSIRPPPEMSPGERNDASWRTTSVYAPNTEPRLPWMHPDPENDSGSGDPKSLVLAALGGWLSQMLVRERAGTTTEVHTFRRELASQLYRVAWLALFGVAKGDGGSAIGDTLQRLLAAWCDSFLWKGPTCDGEPHGVVIGCTVLMNNTIGPIDPFGGRRHVLHYPILSYWGEQFGLAPIDVTAARMFSLICCVSDLPAIPEQEPAAMLSTAMGDSFFNIGAPDAVDQHLRNEQVNVIGTVRVGMFEFAARVLSAINKNQPPGRAMTYIAYTLTGVAAPNVVSLVSPETGQA
jgi:hypothetical protein